MECPPDSLAYAATALVLHAVAVVAVPRVWAVQAVAGEAAESGVVSSEEETRDIVARGPGVGEGARS